MFHFLPIAIRYDGSAPAGEHGYQVHIGPMYSDAARHGEAQVDRSERARRRCASTTSPPSRTGASGSRRSGSRATSSTSRRSTPYNAGELSPGPSVETDEEIIEWVAKDAETALHPSCTAKMGTDDMAVVDPADDAGPRHSRACGSSTRR